MNTRFVKKSVSMVLCLALLLSIIPFAALADTGNLGTGTPDGTPPELTSLTLSATTVTAPGEIEITATATDDVSGVQAISVFFYCPESQKEIACYLGNTYWDEETGQEVPYADGTFRGTLEIDQYTETGTFVLRDILVRDFAQNGLNYRADIHHSYWGGYENAPIPDFVTQQQITVTNASTPDGTPPQLTSFVLSAATVAAPAEIEITATATDDVSGVNEFWVYYWHEETERDIYCYLENTYWDYEAGQAIPYPDGKYHGFLEVGPYQEPVNFVLKYILLKDAAGNGQAYGTNPEYTDWTDYEEVAVPDFVPQQITVTNAGTSDGTPPVITAMTLATTTIAAPGEIEVTATATDDVSGVDHIWGAFRCEETEKEISFNLYNTYWDYEKEQEVPYPDGKFRGTLDIDQYLEAGTFALDYVVVADVADNGLAYCIDYGYHNFWGYDEAPFPDFLAQQQFQVLNAMPDVTTSLANPAFVEQVKNAGEDAYIVADFTNEATLTEAAFSAIAGTDKTLDLVSEGVTWRFNGNDIVNVVKDIGLNVEIKPVEEHPSDAAQQIQEALQDIPAVVMQFPENGQLPGKATIQVKVDYAMREYLGGTRGLCVYYYNNETGELELVAKDLVVINDTFVEFSITHCSNYVLTLDTYTVAFLDEDGSVISSKVYSLGSEVTVPANPTKAADNTYAYEFAGWDKEVVACAGDATYTATYTPTYIDYTVVFVDEDGSELSTNTYHWGEEVTAPADPTKAEDETYTYTFAGWDKELVNCAGNATYKAVYTATEKSPAEDDEPTTPPTEETEPEVTDPEVTEPEVTEPETTEPVEPPMENPFVDVAEDIYYHDPVLWAVNEGITNGMDATHFAPAEICSRGQVVTFLWRANGCPEPQTGYNPFRDVKMTDYFYKAVLWAVENGITSGVAADSFAPGAACTRGQVATFLWRSQGQPSVNGENIFTDIAPGAYYYDAVLWAVANGVTNGMGEGIFAPDATCTRGQIVTFLYRAMN